MSSDRTERLERQLATVQAITHIGSWEWDVSSNAVTWSDELFRIYGLEPQSVSITFEYFLGRLVPEDRERIRGEVTDALARGVRFSYLERIRRADGAIRVLDTLGDVVRGRDGRPSGLIGTCRDVTEERERDELLQVYRKVFTNVQMPIAVWESPADGATVDLRLVTANQASEALAPGLPGCIGRPLAEALPWIRDTKLPDALSLALTQGTVCEVEGIRVPGGGRERIFNAKAFALSPRSVAFVAEDVTTQRFARELLGAEHRMLEMIASSAPLDRVLEAIVVGIEGIAPSTIASILLLDPDGIHLRHGAAPGLPDAYNRRIDGALIGPNAGSCGTAAFERRQVVVTDIETDPRWKDYREIAALAGIRACWSTPIFASDGRVLGTFAFYDRVPRAPSASDFELASRATHIAQIAIQRRQLDDQLRALSEHIEAAREDERTGIAREIHDEMGQSLTAIKLDVAWVQRRLMEKDSDASRLSERLRATSGMIDELIQRVRRISSELRPGVLDDLGLLAALEWGCREFEKRSGCRCSVQSNVGDARVERNLATALFRILQECLTNVARHARATSVDVRLVSAPDALVLSVSDDGQGITPQAISSPHSLGLLGIKERARRFGATVSVAQVAPHGTIVTVSVPAGTATTGASR